MEIRESFPSLAGQMVLSRVLVSVGLNVNRELSAAGTLGEVEAHEGLQAIPTTGGSLEEEAERMKTPKSYHGGEVINQSCSNRPFTKKTRHVDWLRNLVRDRNRGGVRMDALSPERSRVL